MRVTDPEAKLHVVADAVAAIAGSLDLDVTLRAIVEAGRDVTGAGYGALGVLGPDRRIARFITSGVTDEQIEAIGPYPTGRGILGVLIDEARPVRLANLGDDPRSSGFPPHHPAMTSFVGVPVRARGKVFGNLYLTEAPSGEFSEDDERLLVLLANHAGIAIDHAQTFAEARQQAADARRAARARASLTDIAGSILRERDVLQVMSALASEARELVSARLVGIGVAEELTQTIRFPVAVGDGAEELRDRQAPLDDVISGAVLRAGESMRLDRADGEWRGAGLRPIVPCRSQLIVPVVAGDETLAVILAVDSARDEGAFNEDDQDLLLALAPLGAIAFQTARAFRRSEAAAQLRRTEAEAVLRQDALRRVIEAQERERRRIAQDLHDNTAGALASIRLSVKRMERDAPPDLAERLGEASRDISAAIEDLRDLIADLRPKVLDDYGLEPAVERLAHTVGRRTGLSVQFAPSGALGEVPDELATATYRIVQEALVNVARHAGARTVEISASAASGTLLVTVADDGVGVDAGAGNGFGLAGMQERASLVGGRVDVEPRAGGGTLVRFEAPL
jgi:signal transduction histidine kinase